MNRAQRLLAHLERRRVARRRRNRRGVEPRCRRCARTARARHVRALGRERYKVYIVDEAHMLTREAWNALLKILEEPPPRVVFVFATTEPQKIAQTAAPVLTRLQRFDFKRIGPAEFVIAWLVVREEGVALRSPTRSAMIARAADGSCAMRSRSPTRSSRWAMAARHPIACVRALGLVAEDEYLALLDIVAERRAAILFPAVAATRRCRRRFRALLAGLGDLFARCSRSPSVGRHPYLPGAFARVARRARPLACVRAICCACCTVARPRAAVPPLRAAALLARVAARPLRAARSHDRTRRGTQASVTGRAIDPRRRRSRRNSLSTRWSPRRMLLPASPPPAVVAPALPTPTVAPSHRSADTAVGDAASGPDRRRRTDGGTGSRRPHATEPVRAPRPTAAGARHGAGAVVRRRRDAARERRGMVAEVDAMAASRPRSRRRAR